MEKQKFSARVKQAMGEASITNLYQLNGMVPVHKAIPFGLQHILAMFVANIAPILIVGGACGLAASDMAMLIQSAMLIAGIGTLVQLFPIFHKIGSGLPIVMGISFTFVTVLCGVVATYGYSTAIGAIMVGGVIEGVLVLFAKYWRRIISPIVAAVVVTSIGFSLLSVGATSFGGGSGASAKLEPVAFLIIRGESVKLLPVAPPPATTVDRVIEVVPEVVDKVTEFWEKQQEKKGQPDPDVVE